MLPAVKAGSKVTADHSEHLECQGLIHRFGGRSAGGHVHGKAAHRGWGSSPMLNMSQVVGLPWLQTQRQSYKQGLLLVQSCSSAKIKSTRAAPGPAGYMLEAEAGRGGSRTLGEDGAGGTPPAASNRDFSSCRAGKIFPSGVPTAICHQP